MAVVITEEKKLNVVSERIVQELAHHNVRFSEIDKLFEIVKEKASRTVITSQ